jgi:hypothetical protein
LVLSLTSVHNVYRDIIYQIQFVKAFAKTGIFIKMKYQEFVFRHVLLNCSLSRRLSHAFLLALQTIQTNIKVIVEKIASLEPMQIKITSVFLVILFVNSAQDQVRMNARYAFKVY